MNMIKILFFITEDWFFYSHRLNLVKAVKNSGFEVVVVTRDSGKYKFYEDHGIRVVSFNMMRSSISLFRELGVLYSLRKVIKAEKPDIVHLVALKPILYGTLVSRLLGVKIIINAFSGLGSLFVSSSFIKCLMEYLVLSIFKLLFFGKNIYCIFQNNDDLEYFAKKRIINKERTFLIRGSGVDTSLFKPCNKPDGVVNVAFISRIIRDKGVLDFVEAAKMLKNKNIKMIIVGVPDKDNPSSISEDLINEWSKQGIIEWLGKCENVSEIMNNFHIVTLPSYREGLPKVLLEAAACACPIIATDVPGCREICRNGINGILIRKKDPKALKEAICYLADNKSVCKKFGEKGREIVIDEFSEDFVVAQTVEIYNHLLKQIIIDNKF
jgi:glycosyltransferase involved in cell wall biosynthesis